MFKEHSTEKLIEYLRTLPEKEQSEIRKTLFAPKVKQRKKNGKENRSERIKQFQKFVEKHRLNVPDNFKFNREGAHER